MQIIKLSILFLFFGICANAQEKLNEPPVLSKVGFSKILEEGTFPVETLTAPDLKKIEEEDKAYGNSPRFAAPILMNLNPQNAGKWIELENGDRIWLLKVKVPGSKGMAFLYDQFHLPQGARLSMFSEGFRETIGAYSAQNNRPGGKFFTGFLYAETALLEYYEPKSQRGQGRINISRVDFVYKDISQTASSFQQIGYGTSLECHKNINCPEGVSWQKEKRGICRIVMVFDEGTGFCTGNLLNNTQKDGTPYFITGFHCQDGFTPQYDLWRFDFQYEVPNCQNTVSEPNFNSLLGCTIIAGRRENDFLLLETHNLVPDNFNAYFLGWNRQTSPPTSSINIHHPVGDVKKIATLDNTGIIHSQSLDWNNGVITPANHHFEIDYSDGTFELGSSGSGLLDNEGLFRGQLHGGFADCSSTTAFFGRLTLAWEGGGTSATRLRDWLDPLSIGVDSIHGRENILVGENVLSGRVLTETGGGVPGVKVQLSGDINRMVETDANGLYAFNNLPSGVNLIIGFERGGSVQNGIRVSDLIEIRKHILRTQMLSSPYKILAADANGSGDVKVSDLIKFSRIILRTDIDFGSVPNWSFIPASYTFSNPANPFLDMLPDIFHINNFDASVLDLNFIGVKLGDVNDSVDVGN